MAKNITQEPIRRGSIQKPWKGTLLGNGRIKGVSINARIGDYVQFTVGRSDVANVGRIQRWVCGQAEISLLGYLENAQDEFGERGDS